MISVYQPYITEKEIQLVCEAISTKWISANGPLVKQFETMFAEYAGAANAISVCNGTCGLELILAALYKNKRIRRVAIPDFSYVAVANAVANTLPDAHIDLLDVDYNSFVITPQILIDFLHKNKDCKPDVLIFVHNYSSISDIEQISKICKDYGVLLVEDACEAFGCFYKGKHLGAYGEAGCFSFFGNKTITTGEGGMVITNDACLSADLRLIKSQGAITNASVLNRYEHKLIGHNYRMTNLQAAVGVAQLQNLDDIKKKKNHIFGRYYQELKPKFLFRKNQYIDTDYSNFINWLFCVKVENRIEFADYMENAAIEIRPFFKPISSFEFYKQFARKNHISRQLFLTGFNIPSYPDLTEEQVSYIIKTINNFE